MKNKKKKVMVIFEMTVTLIALILSSCAPSGSTINIQNMITPLAPTLVPAPTSGRPAYNPGELVEYTAQGGDTIPALAARFNTTAAEIFEANPIIPREATTMPPGLPMQIPIYYLPLWGTDFKSTPYSAFVNGPAHVGFSTSAFVASSSGWLKNYRAYAGGRNRTGAEMVDYVAVNYSISPRLLLALLEYQSGALTQPELPASRYLLGFRRTFYDTPYLQLVIAANTLNNAYYSWREGELTEFELLDSTLTRPDPWQNAGSVALQYYFSRIYSGNEYYASIGPDGLARVYRDLFGDPWLDPATFGMPGSLQQPELRFPFRAGYIWAYTGGPHAGWGSGQPFAAVDFAPASDTSGCYTVPNDVFATAMADGLVVRSDIDGIIIDLDKDGKGEGKLLPAMRAKISDQGVVEFETLGTDPYKIIKVVQERGGPGRDLEPIAPEVLDAIVTEAHEQGLAVTAHWGTLEDLEDVLAAGVELVAKALLVSSGHQAGASG